MYFTDVSSSHESPRSPLTIRSMKICYQSEMKLPQSRINLQHHRFQPPSLPSTISVPISLIFSILAKPLFYRSKPDKTFPLFFLRQNARHHCQLARSCQHAKMTSVSPLYAAIRWQPTASAMTPIVSLLFFSCFSLTIDIFCCRQLVGGHRIEKFFFVITADAHDIPATVRYSTTTVLPVSSMCP